MSSANGHDPCAGDGAAPPFGAVTAVLDVSGIHWASEKAVVETTLRRLDGVNGVDANSVAQTATVTYDPSMTNVAELRCWVMRCGSHCAGQSVPGHACDPMKEPAADGHASHGEHAGGPDGHKEAEIAVGSPLEMMGHGGHGGASALRPGIAALSMSGSSIIMAVNAVMLKRLPLPSPIESAAPTTTPV